MDTCSFSTSFKDYSFNDCSYKLPSGMTIYYNFSDSTQTNCDCVCPFKGDPDIAGPGVIAGFVVAAWITCIVAAIDAYCVLSRSLLKSISRPGRGDADAQFRERVDRLVSLGLSEEFYSRYPRIKQAVQFLVAKFCLRRVVKRLLGLFRHEMPRTRYFAKVSLDTLCDIQVVTGTAIIIAALVQIHTMTFYHQQFVLSYWFLTLNAFWAGRAGHRDNDDDSNDDWHYWTRTAATFFTSVLSIVFQLLVVPKQAESAEWNPVKSGSCYIGHDKSAYNPQYLWIAGLFLYAGYLFLSLTSGVLYFLRVRPSNTGVRLNNVASANKTWMDKITTDVKDKEEKTRKNCKKWIRKFLGPATSQDLELQERHNQATGATAPAVIQNIAGHRFPTPIHYFLKAFFNFALVIWWTLRQFLALWAWGDPQSVLIVLSYFGFAAWNTYDIIDLKQSNWYLVQDEFAWGFGQVLPVVLLLLVFLNILDAIKEARSRCHAPYHSKPSVSHLTHEAYVIVSKQQFYSIRSLGRSDP